VYKKVKGRALLQ